LMSFPSLVPPRIIYSSWCGIPGIMTKHSELVRWAVLGLRVAPSGDFKNETVAHAEWHFKLACCPRAAQGAARVLIHEVVALLGSLGYPPPLWVTSPKGV
jgi:hypothetical protein